MSQLVLADDQAASDFATFTARALRIDPDGAMRLQASGTTLATWVQVLPGRGLMHSGLTLGLRVQALREPAELDAAVSLAALRDRLARGVDAALSVPPQEVTSPWLGISPPRTGWQPQYELEVGELRTAARGGIDEVAAGTPEHAGAAAVAALRGRVWGRELAPGLPAAAAFGADALGFLVNASALWHTCGPWGRLRTDAGFVLTR